MVRKSPLKGFPSFLTVPVAEVSEVTTAVFPYTRIFISRTSKDSYLRAPGARLSVFVYGVPEE